MENNKKDYMTLEEKMNERLKPLSSISKEREIIYTVSEVARYELNNIIEKKIQQNKRERISSEIAMKDIVVGD